LNLFNSHFVDEYAFGILKRLSYRDKLVHLNIQTLDKSGNSCHGFPILQLQQQHTWISFNRFRQPIGVVPDAFGLTGFWTVNPKLIKTNFKPQTSNYFSFNNQSVDVAADSTPISNSNNFDDHTITLESSDDIIDEIENDFVPEWVVTSILDHSLSDSGQLLFQVEYLLENADETASSWEGVAELVDADGVMNEELRIFLASCSRCILIFLSIKSQVDFMRWCQI
jgi:hypothetical protein